MSAPLWLIVGLLTGGPPTTAPTTAPPTTSVLEGTFHNERGSVLTLQVGVDGVVFGTFRSGVGTVDAAKRFAVTGRANGDVVGFVVDFGSVGSVGSWSGQLRGDDLVCLWLLSKNIDDEHEARDLWGSVRTGSDVFSRCTDCTP